MPLDTEDTLHQHCGECVREDARCFSLEEAIRVVEERLPSVWFMPYDEDLQTYFGTLNEETRQQYAARKRARYAAQVPDAGGSGPDQVPPEAEAPEDH